MNEPAKLPGLGLTPGQIHPRVITCGDPGRAEKIAGLLENPQCLVQRREFWTYNGLWGGVPVTVNSHGVGGAGAIIIFESLCLAGAKSIIRVGTCGSLQPEIPAAGIVIATGACRDDGVTERMLPLCYPAVADPDMVLALRGSARLRDCKVYCGLIMTTAMYYPGLVPSVTAALKEAGVLAIEMELAPLLVTATRYGVKAGGIFAADSGVGDTAGLDGYTPDTCALQKAIDDEIIIALDALAGLPAD